MSSSISDKLTTFHTSKLRYREGKWEYLIADTWWECSDQTFMERSIAAMMERNTTNFTAEQILSQVTKKLTVN